MIANDIYKAALSLTFTAENNAQDFKTYFVPFLNLCLAEALHFENSIRESRGEEKLDSAPLITAFEEEIPYDDAITRIALPYGVASYYFQDDMDDYRYQEHRGRFVSALQDAAKIMETDIEDVYV
ncbi:MAG TPA: hypothetical protein DCY75_03035 [Clostridiales bacterium]|nr:hypothetical protein [Clostridiales bacterium]